MRTLISKQSLVLFVSLALIFALTAMPSTAQQKTRVAGEMTCTYTKQETITVGETKGHIISLGESEGTNVSTGKQKFLDGAQVVNMSYGDLVQGNGPHQGYIKFATPADTTFAKWQGKVTTTLSAEGTPITTFEGTFSYIKKGQVSSQTSRGVAPTREGLSHRQHILWNGKANTSSKSEEIASSLQEKFLQARSLYY